MPTQKTLREILNEFRNKPSMDDLNPIAWEKVFTNSAISEIKSLLKEKLPKKKVNSIPAPHTPLTESDILAKYMNFGYNQAITEIEKIVEEL